MSREGNYLAFAIEQYRFAKGLSGAEAWRLFREYALDKFVMDAFEMLHIEGERNLVAALDERIAAQGGKVPDKRV